VPNSTERSSSHRAHLFTDVDTGTWRVEITADLPGGDDWEIPPAEDQSADPALALDLGIPLAQDDLSEVQRAAETALLAQAGDEWYVGAWYAGHGELLAEARRERFWARRALVTVGPDGRYRVSVHHPLYVDPDTAQAELDDAAPPVLEIASLLPARLVPSSTARVEMARLLARRGWHGWYGFGDPDQFPVHPEPLGHHFATLTATDGGGWWLDIETPDGGDLVDQALPVETDGHDWQAAELAAESVCAAHGMRPQGEWDRFPRSGHTTAMSTLRLTAAGPRARWVEPRYEGPHYDGLRAAWRLGEAAAGAGPDDPAVADALRAATYRSAVDLLRDTIYVLVPSSLTSAELQAIYRPVLEDLAPGTVHADAARATADRAVQRHDGTLAPSPGPDFGAGSPAATLALARAAWQIAQRVDAAGDTPGFCSYWLRIEDASPHIDLSGMGQSR
jgi:hypothetical protein